MICFEKYFHVVTVKQSIESSKQLGVLPLTTLHKSVMVAYAWLQLFLLLKIFYGSNMHLMYL